MTDAKSLREIIPGSSPTISVRLQLLASLMDDEYRNAFVQERVRSSVALQIRSLRDQRKMTQQQLGDAIGMAQTWVSKLENPEYGKMTVSTLLRLANEFDTDLEIKFRPFSRTIHDLPRQGPDYFQVRSFREEVKMGFLSRERLIEEREDTIVAELSIPTKSAYFTFETTGYSHLREYHASVSAKWEPGAFDVINLYSYGPVVYKEAPRILAGKFKGIPLFTQRTTAEQPAA